MAKKKVIASDLSTEERIKTAARTLFTKKGFAAVKTRDIAKEAEINLALLNYYFRSKEKLFEIVMRENMERFIGVITEHLMKTELSIEEKIEILVTHYIDMLIENPDLPFFILNHMQSSANSAAVEPGGTVKNFSNIRSTFFKQLEEAIVKGKIVSIHPLHIISNLIGMTVFPFIAKGMLTERLGRISHSQFEELMQERKKMIPIWMKVIMKTKIN